MPQPNLQGLRIYLSSKRGLNSPKKMPGDFKQGRNHTD